MATLGSSTFDMALSFDMRDLVYRQLLPSEFANNPQNMIGSGFLSYGNPGFPYGEPEQGGYAAIDEEMSFFGDFSFVYDELEVEEISGTVTQYFYRIDGLIDPFNLDELMVVWIYDFAVDVSQFRALSNEELSELIFSGNDFIFGASAADTLLGFTGDDAITGGGGADVLYGGDGSDTADYSTAASGVIASLGNAAINSGDAAGDIYHDIENLAGTDYDDSLNGTQTANVIDGDDGNDTLKGYRGNDQLLGGTGNDILIGGMDGDVLSGGLGSDTASYYGAAAGVYASLANASINTKDAKGDSYLSVENLTGSSFDDRLNGSTLDNVIKGGDGNDIIKGYAGNDTLSGGAGSDTFVFNTALDAASNIDTITDFTLHYNPDQDSIHLDDAIFTQVGPAGASPLGFRANTTGKAQDADARVIYETDTGKLVYDADGNGSIAGIHFATLAPNLFLSDLDFVVI